MNCCGNMKGKMDFNPEEMFEEMKSVCGEMDCCDPKEMAEMMRKFCEENCGCVSGRKSESETEVE